MEADWEVEVGGNAPVLDADWPGLVNLRIHPERIGEIEETHDLSALVEVLVHLNESGSPIYTAKCDVWIVDGLDCYELDASEEDARFGMACYIDMVPEADAESASLDAMIRFGRTVCRRLREVPLRCCRVDIIVRRAVFFSELEGFGVTAYVTGCGASRERAESRLSATLSALANTVYPHKTLPGSVQG